MIEPQLRVANRTISTQPTTRTYIKDIPILGYTDVVNEQNQVYPFVNKEEKVPIIDNHVNVVPLPRTYSVPHYFGCPCNQCRTMTAMKDVYENVKQENERGFLLLKKHQYQQRKSQIESEVKELLNFKDKVENMVETQKKKHQKRRKIFDEKDFNLLYQLQQSQKDLNNLVMSQKIASTDKFLSDNEQLNERLQILENNQINQHWKDHYKKIDEIHGKRTNKIENYIKDQAHKHNEWLNQYQDWYDEQTQMQRDAYNQQMKTIADMQARIWGYNNNGGSEDQSGQTTERTNYTGAPSNPGGAVNRHQNYYSQPRTSQSHGNAINGGGGGNNVDFGYEQTTPMFNPFWNPYLPMPYPVVAPKLETFSPTRNGGGGGHHQNHQGQFQSPGMMSPGAGRTGKSSLEDTLARQIDTTVNVPINDKYKTYWNVLKDDPTMQEKALNYDDRLNYFLPPLREEGKNTNFIYPTVLSNDAILTAKGILPRNGGNTNGKYNSQLR